MYVLQKGNPKDESRLAREQESYAFLDSLGIAYDRVDHEPHATISACAEVDALLGVRICKNLFLRNSNGSRYYLLLMPGDKPFRTKVLSAEIGSTRLSFADAGAMEEMLGVTPGSVTVLGLMYDREHRVELLIDREVLEEAYFACHPCINTSSIRFSTEELLGKVLPALGHEAQIVTLAEGTEA